MAWKRIVGWVRESSYSNRPDNELPGMDRPSDPDYGMEVPVDPGYGRPGIGGGGYPSTGPIKPGGLPILPPHPSNGLPPVGHPWGPGHWIPVDPGYGKPPIFGFKPVDPGFGVGSGLKPDNSLPGHWVPVDPGYDIPCGGKIRAIWVFIVEIGPDFGLKPDNSLPETAEPK